MYARQMTHHGRRWLYARRIRPETAELVRDAYSMIRDSGLLRITWRTAELAAAAVRGTIDHHEIEPLAAEIMEYGRRAIRGTSGDPLERPLLARPGFGHKQRPIEAYGQTFRPVPGV